MCRHILFGFKSYYVLKRVFSQRLKNIWQDLKWCISETTTNKWWCIKSNWRQIRIHRGWLIDFRVIYVWKYNVGLIVLIDAGTKSAALGVKCNSGFWFLVGYYIFLPTFMFKEKVLKIKKWKDKHRNRGGKKVPSTQSISSLDGSTWTDLIGCIHSIYLYIY